MTAVHAAETAHDEPGADDAASPAVPRSWFGPALAVLGGVMGAGALSDNSFLTHLATGRIILDDGVPRVDPYTFTAGGDPWVVSSWLASWFYAIVESVGGLAGVRILVAAATAVTVGFVWRTTAPARGVLVRVGLVALVVVLSGGWFSERPQIFAFAAAAGLMVVLRERRSPWWMLPLGMVWVNVHASWPMGLVLLALWAGALFIDNRAIDRHSILCAAAFALAVVQGAVLSPFGLKLLSFPIEMLGKVDTLSFIKEWRRPAVTDPDLWIFAVALIVAVVLALRARRPGTALASLALAAPVALGVRNIPLAAMMLVTLSAPFLAGMGDEQIGPVPSIRQLRAAGVLGAAAVVALIMATPNLDLGPYPVEVLDDLEEASGEGLGGLRILSLDYVGNYLGFRDGTDANAWNDDRAEVVPHEVFADYVTLLSTDPRPEAWADIVNRYEFDVIVWPADDPFGRWLEGGGMDQVGETYSPANERCVGGLAPVWSVEPGSDEWLVATRHCASVGF